MTTTIRHRNGILRGPLAVILILALMAPVLEAKERRGANLVVTKKDGTVVRGELLAVKGTDLLIMDGSTSSGITVSLADVQTVKVAKESKFLKGLELGFLIGAPAGTLLGLATGKQNPGWFEYTPAQGAVMGCLSLGFLGALIGGTAGAIAGIDKNIRIGDSSPVGVARVGNELRPLARDRS